MNNPRFAAMRAQLGPSAEAEEALRRRLTERAPRRRSRWQYLTAAACAALLLCAYPVYRGMTAPPQHSYVLIGPGDSFATGDSYSAEENVSTPEDAPVDTSPVPDPSPGPESKPYEGEGLEAYQSLLSHFGGALYPSYPDWYGGTYLNDEGRLVVFTVTGSTPDLPEALQGSAVVLLENRARYSYAYLLSLQEQVVDAMLDLGIFAGCGVDVEANRLYLAIREVNREALTLLAELDPEDDAIYVEITPYPATITEDRPASDAVSEQHDIESPVLYFGDPDAPVPNEDDAIAYEPADPN